MSRSGLYVTRVGTAELAAFVRFSASVAAVLGSLSGDASVPSVNSPNQPESESTRR
ncbi:hypothetical protein GGF31_006326 [Allomyces arbusculus]|nr:hypothetical protein GGF31_006326 [Allomyces arbusculus]